jgi:hypothetical protein
MSFIFKIDIIVDATEGNYCVKNQIQNYLIVSVIKPAKNFVFERLFFLYFAFVAA